MSQMNHRKTHIIISGVIFMALFSQPAFAYLDMGTGSYLFQVGLAVFMLFVYTIRSFIGNLFRSLKNAVIKLLKFK